MGKGRKITYNIVKEEFEKQNYILVSDEYINVKQELKYICKKHEHRGIQQIKYFNFDRGSKCPFCMIEEGHPPNHLPEVVYKEETEKMNYTFVGVGYVKQGAVIEFVCNKHPSKGVQKANWTSIRDKKCSCGICNGTNKTTDEFKDEIAEILPNIEIYGEYTGARKRINCSCKICKHKWKPLAYNLKSGYGCPKCADRIVGLKKRTSIQEKMNTLINLHPDINFLSQPRRTTDKVECQCKKCGHEWSATYGNLTNQANTTGCPMCAGSNSENKLINIIKSIGLQYEPQKTFEDCRNINKLPFDVYLIDFHVLIEFDGEGHYYPIPRSKDDDGVENFKKTQINDDIKNKYCKKNKIPLIRIPYWERDDMEYFVLDKLIKLSVLEEIQIA